MGRKQKVGALSKDTGTDSIFIIISNSNNNNSNSNNKNNKPGRAKQPGSTRDVFGANVGSLNVRLAGGRTSLKLAGAEHV